ncbi:MAG: nucleoside 2-deoxyribosyltransferase domain-containing protein [Niastella sp.]|jgi:hypothetical protein|uniref:nucleoside 2-deoxyribosyltransferase domain-containing protein n=1 Tax=Niastella sp. TaxID=1869183 RepID=UPI00389A9D39
MKVLTPPHEMIVDNQVVVFLAGSIEMGIAKEWQQLAIDLFDSMIPEEKKADYLLLNPRRPDWDPSWKQEIDNPPFYEQVKWELKGLQQADHILVYFDPATKSPVSLLELGAFHNKAIVICPQGFWRKGNVDIFCDVFNVKQAPDLKSAVALIVGER